ncbi:putative gluconokinase [Enterococcus faecalis 13-SD-W-01]|nr:putative gluconokinase [Enterococcus faecalis 13-SD-W-01]
MNVSIGVDIGTTQTKAAAFSDNGKALASCYFKYPLIQETEGMAEQDQELIFQGVINVIREVVQQLPEKTVIDFVSFSSAMHSLILLDDQKIPLTKMITWADNRAAGEAENLKQLPLGKEIYQLTGTPIHPMTPLTKIKWLQTENPALFEKSAYFIGIKELIFQRFFDILACDYGNASGTGYFNIHTFEWEKTALDYINLSPTKLPKTYPSTQLFTGLKDGYAEKMQLPINTPFVLGGADGPLSNLGLGAFGEGKGALTVGTSGALRYITKEPYLHPNMETFCYVLDKKHWVVGGATSNGAGIFEWARQTFFAHSDAPADYQQIFSLIEEVPPGSHGLLFQPYLLGERAPLWQAEASGSFVGLRRNHTEKEMIRAVVEGICFNLRRILAGTGVIAEKITELRGTGGFANSEVFRQIMADILGRPLVFPKNNEASALGSVILGWQSLGKIHEFQEAHFLFEETEQVAVQEDNHQLYQQIYPLFVQTQKQMAENYQQLAELRKKLANPE